MKTIVVPVDFSKVSRNAARYAIDLAAAYKAQVKFLSVIEMQQQSTQLKNWSKLQAQLERETKKNAEAFMNEMTGYGSAVQMSHVTSLGSPIEDVIVSFAKKQKGDLIVTGTQGASGLKALTVGSNSAALINKSKIPVLTIPANSKLGDLRYVTLATDLTNLDKQARLVVNFVKPFDSHINILHIANPERRKRDRTDLQSILSRMTGYRKLSITEMRNNDVMDGLDAFVEQSGADLLVMFTHHLNQFEILLGKGHTRKMAFKSRLPLLAFRKW